MRKVLSKPSKSLRRLLHRHLPRTPSLDEAVNRLTREAERLKKHCDQQTRMTKDLFQHLQQMVTQIDTRFMDLAHTGFHFLNNDLDAGLNFGAYRCRSGS